MTTRYYLRVIRRIRLRMQGPVGLVELLVRVGLLPPVEEHESAGGQLDDHIDNGEGNDGDVQPAQRVPNGGGPVLADPGVPDDDGPDDVEDGGDDQDGDDDPGDAVVVARVPVEVADEPHHDVVVAADHAVDEGDHGDHQQHDFDSVNH